MGIQSSYFTVDGSTKTFPSTKHIATKQHMAVWIQLVSDNSYIQLSVTEYELINNSAVLTNSPAPTTYLQLELRVADEPDELGESQSNIAIVASLADEIIVVSEISNEVVVVANNNANITLVANDITSVNTVAGISTEVANVSNISTDVVGVNAIASDVTAVNTEPLRQSILDADTNATNAEASAAAALVSENNAKASEISASDSASSSSSSATSSATARDDARNWSSEEEDVVVSDGVNPSGYSAYHWSKKASAIVLEPLIMAVGNINNPLLDLPLNNSLAMKQGVGSVTFTRSTTATYVDRYGVFQTASVDEPRFEKDGLLIESTSINTSTYSEEFDNAVWTKIGGAITANSTIAPDGNTTADKFTATVSETETSIYKTETIVSGEYITRSIFIKLQSGSIFNIAMFFVGGTLETNASYISLSDGSIVADLDGNCKVDIISDDYIRVSKTILTNDVSTSIRLNITDSSTSISWSSSALGSEYIEIWGNQLEELKLSSSYIATSTTFETRENELVEITLENNIPNSNKPTTLIIDLLLKGTNSSNAIVISSGDTKIYCSGSLENDGFVSGYRNTITSQTSDITNVNVRIAIVDDRTNVILYKDGEAISTVASIAATSLDSTIKINGLGNGFFHIKNIRWFDKSLTTQEINIA